MTGWDKLSENREILIDFMWEHKICPSKFGLNEHCSVTCYECWYEVLEEDEY